MNFEFLNYLESNPGMSIHELVDIFKQVYPEVEEKEKEEPVGVSPSEETEDVQNAVVGEVGKARTTGQVVPEVPEESRRVGETEGEA